MKQLTLHLIAVFFTSNVLAASYEITKMKDILRTVAQNTIYVFDIDNTILTPKQMLGSDQWYGNQVKKLIESGLDESRAIDRIIPLWIRIQSRTQVVPVETSTPALIRMLQIKNIPVMALTARPIQGYQFTQRQFSDLNINLNKGANGKAYKNVGGYSDAAFINGVLFVGPKNNKGEILRKFFQEHNIQPARIVFVDDKRKHIDNLEKAFANSNIEYIGFRYGATDSYVQAYNPTIANKQLEFFLKFDQLIDDSTIASKTAFGF